MRSSTNHSLLDQNHKHVITNNHEDLSFLSFSRTFIFIALMFMVHPKVSSSNNPKRKVFELENEEERREIHLFPPKKRIYKTINGSLLPKETPNWLISHMRDMEGYEPKKNAEKTLTKSDVKKGEARLLIPFSKLIEPNFLNQEELRIMEEDRNRAKKIGVEVLVIDQSGSITWRSNLRRWDMKKQNSRKITNNFVLVSGWNHVVETNELKENDSIIIWSFRSRGALCFAMAPLD